jgi:hypothetical protein
MTVLYESSSSDLESQFGSPHGYHNIFAGHLRERNIDRSRPSTSPFLPKFEMSPASVPMGHNFSASSFSDPEIDPDWNSFNFNEPVNDLDSTSPMSNHAYQDFIPNWHSVNSFTEAPQAMNTPASQPQQTTDNFGFSFPQHQFTNGQQALGSKTSICPLLHVETRSNSRLAHRARAPISIPNTNHGWNYPDDLSPGIKTDNSLSDQEIFSASSFSTQASYQQPPWSPVDHSRVPSIGITQHMSFGSASALPVSHDAYRTSYAGSVLSMDSSPQARGIGTPNSERSPLFAPAHLSGSMGSTNSHQCQGHDHQHETPRAMQQPFQQTRTLNVDVIGIGMGSQSQGNKGRRSQAPREPTHSPVSDYVMVESVDISAVSPSFSGFMKAEPSTSAPRSPVTFVTEQYPLVSDSGKQASNQGVIRKTREGKRAGGRSLGSHLPADKAARAKQLREEGSCWICCLQRDSVCFYYS